MRHLVILIFLLSIPLISREKLSVDDAVRIALENNYNIRIEKNLENIARNNNTYGNAGFLPTVDATGSYSTSSSNVEQEFIDGRANDVDGAVSTSLRGGIELSWTIFDGFRMFARKEQLEKEIDISREQLRMRLQNTAADVISAYSEIASLNAEYKVILENIGISRERLRIINNKFEIGSASELEVLQAQTDLNADLSDSIDIGAEVRNAKTNLNYLLARNLEEEFVVNELTELRSDLLRKGIIDSALVNNPAIKISQLQIKTAELDKDLIASEFYPRINAFGDYSYSRSESQSGFLAQNTSHGYTLGVNLSMNLFNGMNTSREMQNSQLVIENNRINAELLEQSIISQIIRTYNIYRTGLEKIEFETENIISAEKTLEIAVERLRLGNYSPLELREAQRSFAEAQNRLIQARYAAYISAVEMLRLSGSLTQ